MKTCIVTGGSSNQFPAMAVLALNIADICPDIADELIFFHDNIPLEEQKKVQQIFPTRFIQYTSPFSSNTGFQDNVTSYFSPFVFCKYECFKLLNEYDCVIWTDYDIIIYKDISEIAKKKKCYAKFPESSILASKFEKQLFINHANDAKKMNLFQNGVATPLFVLYKSFPNYNKFYQELIEYTSKYADSLYLPEEAIFSLLFQKKHINFDKIDKRIYVTTPDILNGNENKMKIFHACGQPKFWNGRYNEKWEQYHKIWVNNYKGIDFPSDKPQQNLLKRVIKKLLSFKS